MLIVVYSGLCEYVTNLSGLLIMQLQLSMGLSGSKLCTAVFGMYTGTDL